MLDALFAAPLGAFLIFSLRIVDVSMSIMRMILAVRGHRGIAAAIGFFEVMLWLIAVGKALQHMDSIFHVIGYAGGFAAGNYVGVWLEGQFALGLNVVRAVCRSRVVDGIVGGAHEAAVRLREQGYAVTEISGRGRESAVDILNIVVQRKEVPQVIRLLQAHDPDAFVTVEEVRTSLGGYIRPGGRKMPFLVKT